MAKLRIPGLSKHIWCIISQYKLVPTEKLYCGTDASGQLAHPRSDELDAAEERRGVGVLLRHVRLIGPDPPVQPRHQVDVVGDPPRQLLRRVHVGVHKPYQSKQSSNKHKRHWKLTNFCKGKSFVKQRRAGTNREGGYDPRG